MSVRDSETWTFFWLSQNFKIFFLEKFLIKRRRLAVSCFRSVSKASTNEPLHTLTAEFGWDLVFMCAEWPIAQQYWLWTIALVEYIHAARPKDFAAMATHWPLGSIEPYKANTSLRDKLNLSRSPNQVGSHAYNACSQLSRLHRMYHFQHTDIVFRRSRLFSTQFLSVDR